LLLDFASEQEALAYIKENEHQLHAALEKEEMRTVYTRGCTRIRVMKDGKRLLRITARFCGDKAVSEIYGDMVSLRVISS